MAINKSEVIKQLLSKFNLPWKSYQHHHAAAMYVLENFWKDKYEFTELEQESVDEFLSAFSRTSDLYDKLIEIARKKTAFFNIAALSARFDDYLDRAATISFADKQNFLKKDELWRLGYSAAIPALKTNKS